ncbi:unnamed protein product [Schistosoma curassoni]|uniref:Reverse transcriptase domain-containing protein n=1 Tax=Schistosoma curassoni TaxID=6186 RepID=A0A183KFP4_9TREM|nr:unnamed protein product [Schistosoma curassoni]
MQLDDLDFTDDLDLLSHKRQEFQEKTTSVAAASAAVGLNIHKGKSKILQYNIACTNRIILDGEALEEVRALTYLDSIIDKHGGSNADVKARISNARAAYLQMKNICNSKQLSTNQHQGQNFQYKCQHSSAVCGGNQMVVRGIQQEILDPGFLLLGTHQQDVPVILRELVLPDGFDHVSPNFVTTGLSGSRPISCMTEI